jgi:excisionase family DNA binding protein
VKSETAMLTPSEIAKQLRCSSEKVIRLIKSGDLTGIQFSEKRGAKRGRFLVARESLQDFLERRTVSPSVKTARRKRQQAGKLIEFF